MRSRFLALWAAAAIATAALVFAPTSHITYASTSGIVISAIYGGGGDQTGPGGSISSPYTHDYIEIFNAGTTAVNLTGWSIQYRDSAPSSSWEKTSIVSGTILQPGQYYLTQQDPGGAGVGSPLPTPDATGSASMTRAGNFVVALMSTLDTIVGDDPRTDLNSQDDIEDLFGGGDATTELPSVFEGSIRTGILDNTTAWFRNNAGCQDTDNNLIDFTVGMVAGMARNSMTPLAPCTASSDVVVQVTDTPDNILTGETVTYTVNVQNTGAAAANNVAIDVDMSGSAYPGTISTLSNSTDCSFTNPTVTCSVASIAVSGAFTFTFQVTPSVSGTITADASVSADAPETTGNNLGTVSTTVSDPVIPSDVSVSITSTPNPVTVGDTTAYSVTVNSTGGVDATNTVLTVTLGGSAYPGTATDLMPAGCSFTNPVITCNLGTLAATSGTVNVSFNVTPAVTGTITADAAVSADAPETAANNTASETTVVSAVVQPVGNFDLNSPHEGEILRTTTAVFSWAEATGAISYEVYLSHLSSNTRIGETYSVTKNSGDVCSAGICSVASTELVTNLKQGSYTWTVMASNGVDGLEASNGPNAFTVDGDGVELVIDGGFEGGATTWTFANGGKYRCGAFGDNSDCALNLKPDATAVQSDQMAPILANLDSTSADVLQVSAAVLSKRVDRQRVVMVVVNYASPTAGINGNGKDKFKLFVEEITTGYETFSANFALADTIVSGKVVVRNALASGKLRVDDVSVMLMPIGTVPRADAAVSTNGVLPVPAAPDNFRGNN